VEEATIQWDRGGSDRPEGTCTEFTREDPAEAWGGASLADCFEFQPMGETEQPG